MTKIKCSFPSRKPTTIFKAIKPERKRTKMEKIMEFKVTIVENALELFEESFEVKEEAKAFFTATTYYKTEIAKEMLYEGIMQEYIDLFGCTDSGVIFDRFVEVKEDTLEFDYKESKAETNRSRCYFTVKCRFDIEKFVRVMDQGVPVNEADKDKEYYIKAYNTAYDKLLEQAKKDGAADPQDAANNLFDEIANAEEIAGSYLVYHGEFAFGDWMNNLLFYKERSEEKQKEFSPIEKKQDAQITKILSKICDQIYVCGIEWKLDGKTPKRELIEKTPINNSDIKGEIGNIPAYLREKYGVAVKKFTVYNGKDVYEIALTDMLGLRDIEFYVPEGMEKPEMDTETGVYSVAMPSTEKFNTDEKFLDRIRVEIIKKYGYAPVSFSAILPDCTPAGYHNSELSDSRKSDKEKRAIAAKALADIYLEQYGALDALAQWNIDNWAEENTHMFSDDVKGILSVAYYEAFEEKKTDKGTGCYGAGSEACLNGCKGCDKKPKEHAYTVGNVQVKTTETKPLTEAEIRCFWDEQAMFILWNDGTDSMCQENGYELADIIQAVIDGRGQVFFDGYDPEKDPSYELRMAQYMDQLEYEHEKNSRFVSEPVKEWLIEYLEDINGKMCVMTGTASEIIEKFCKFTDCLGVIATDTEHIRAEKYKEFIPTDDTEFIGLFLDESEPEPRLRARDISKIKRYGVTDDLKKVF